MEDQSRALYQPEVSSGDVVVCDSEGVDNCMTNALNNCIQRPQFSQADTATASRMLLRVPGGLSEWFGSEELVGLIQSSESYSHYDVHSYSLFGGDGRWGKEYALDWGTELMVSTLKTHCLLGFVSHS